MAKYIPIGEPINKSERDGIRQLRDRLPDHYIVIGNFELQLPRRKNTMEYDAVIVGEWGLYAVEIRGWGGKIRGDIRRWELEWGRVENPFIRIERKAKALRDLLVQSVDGFPDKLFCEAVVFLTGEDIDLEVNDERNRRLLLPGGVYDFFVDQERLIERGPGPLLDEAMRDEIVEAISPLASARSPLPVIQNIEVETELAAANAPYREFLGRHTLLQSRGKVRIKAYSMDPLLPKPEQDAEYNRAVRDMEALTKLEDNAYIARPYELLQDREDELTFYLVSEWVGPTTLREYAKQTDYDDLNDQTIAELTRFAKHLLKAIAFMHSRDIIHRNLHPGVIYLTNSTSGVPLKIADFDYARVANMRSIAGQISDLGTEGYAAPELWMEEGYDHRVDIFSVGVMIFELFTGRYLYRDLPEMLRHDEVWAEKRRYIDDSGLREVLDRLVASNPDERAKGFDFAQRFFASA
jgi:tRNA A-37 threonylcarbamoyl transferase component Bud32